MVAKMNKRPWLPASQGRHFACYLICQSTILSYVYRNFYSRERSTVTWCMLLNRRGEPVSPPRQADITRCNRQDCWKMANDEVQNDQLAAIAKPTYVNTLSHPILTSIDPESVAQFVHARER